eukprot:TRINITY_DN1088_c0_g1_i7.p1 TRINITY_DN1088_c0_g1~~TRINITY_DN1088_c0_g1_i7.p1  ORF type:complete len:409 (-),score=110.09 TRINITY_DN1088_c0_g1_i7:292-1518(-)
MENVQSLQQVLANYGLIKRLDTRKLSEGKLVVDYFDIKAASSAYRGLKEERAEIQVDYIFDSKVQLAPVNESSDSGRSERSEEEGDSERRAKEALESTKQKIKEEYERSDNSLNSSQGADIAEDAGQFQDANIQESDLSFDNDALNEGVKVNSTSQFEPQLLPKGYRNSGAILHTDSTNMDGEDSVSKLPYSDSLELGVYGDYSEGNSQLFHRTQPVKNLFRHSFHSHTRSYDPGFIRDIASPLAYIPSYCDWYTSKNGYGQVYDAARMLYMQEGQEEKKMDFTISLKDILDRKDTRTTLMIRNIPNKYTQKMILQKIDEKHIMEYDFFYLPIDPKNNCNVGYGFINFVSPLYIPGFYAEMNAARWEKFNSEKVCRLTYARIQGLRALLEHFQFFTSLAQQVSLLGER